MMQSVSGYLNTKYPENLTIIHLTKFKNTYVLKKKPKIMWSDKEGLFCDSSVYK